MTVPAYFNDSQRQATKEAGEIAGLEVKCIINEPTAAALAYGLDKKSTDQKIVVFDLGGGTHDVSILELGMASSKFVHDGDTHLGGDDFDQAIIDWLVEEFKSENGGLDLSKDPMALQRLKEAAEKAKIELSSTNSTHQPPLHHAGRRRAEALRALHEPLQVRALTDALVKRTIEPCQTALKAAGLSTSDIDEVILVGGSTRIPAVQEAVTSFGKEPSKGVNPTKWSPSALPSKAESSAETSKMSSCWTSPPLLGIETMGGVMTKLTRPTRPSPPRRAKRSPRPGQPAQRGHQRPQGKAPAADNRSIAAPAVRHPARPARCAADRSPLTSTPTASST